MFAESQHAWVDTILYTRTCRINISPFHENLTGNLIHTAALNLHAMDIVPRYVNSLFLNGVVHQELSAGWMCVVANQDFPVSNSYEMLPAIRSTEQVVFFVITVYLFQKYRGDSANRYYH